MPLLEHTMYENIFTCCKANSSINFYTAPARDNKLNHSVISFGAVHNFQFVSIHLHIGLSISWRKPNLYTMIATTVRILLFVRLSSNINLNSVSWPVLCLWPMLWLIWTVTYSKLKTVYSHIDNWGYWNMKEKGSYHLFKCCLTNLKEKKFQE